MKDTFKSYIILQIENPLHNVITDIPSLQQFSFDFPQVRSMQGCWGFTSAQWSIPPIFTAPLVHLNSVMFTTTGYT